LQSSPQNITEVRAVEETNARIAAASEVLRANEADL
jgi:hypothetical protein